MYAYLVKVNVIIGQVTTTGAQSNMSVRQTLKREENAMPGATHTLSSLQHIAHNTPKPKATSEGRFTELLLEEKCIFLVS